MVTLSEKIEAFGKLGEYILSFPEELKQMMLVAQSHNQWFDIQSQTNALIAIANEFLEQEKLKTFADTYNLSKLNPEPKTVAIILAGNIPMVGFHDILCVLLSGNKALIKLSSKDNKLTRAIVMKLVQIEPKLSEFITVKDSMLESFDAVIATGSDNSARYFEEYFGKYPNIIRKNRNSVAIITGNETDSELRTLGNDVFQFYGLGCRNVSKIFVPKEYDFSKLLKVFNEFSEVKNNVKYKNNFDYNLTLFILNNIPYKENDCILLKEDESLHSRIATLHYHYYENKQEVERWLKIHEDKIQVVVGKNYSQFGETQNPSLTDYADNVDTMEFLLNLNK